MSTSSKFLGRRHLRGLNRLGDSFLPGDGTLPSFSDSGCDAGIDAVLEHLPASDRNDLSLLLGILGLLPAFFTGWFVALLDRSENIPTGIGTLLRFARIGVRGLVMSLYFGHEPVLGKIDYHVGVYMGDLELVEVAGTTSGAPAGAGSDTTPGTTET